MSRLSTGSATAVGKGYDHAELEQAESEQEDIIVELRNALGAIPDVVQAYGTVEDTLILYNNDEPGLRDEGEESAESESEEVIYLNSLNNLRPEPAVGADPLSAQAPPVAEGGESGERESDEQIYVESLGDLNLTSAEGIGPPSAQAVPIAPSAAAKYENVRKETDHRLAVLARFLPDKVREALDKKFAAAVKLTNDKTDAGYEKATTALVKLQESLDDNAPQIRTAAVSSLRKQIQRTLDQEGGVLLKDDKKEFVERFAALDKDLPADEHDAEAQFQALQDLSNDLEGAIEGRLKSISDLCVDYERLMPIVERALSIESDRHDDLADAKEEIENGFSGQFVSDGLTIEEIKAKLSGLEKIVHDVFASFTVDDALEEQKKSLPASPSSLEPTGPALGRGAFGEVFELDNDGGTKLVGKSFKAGDDNARKEMEHEAEIYARIGDHPNIAKCYGIHEVDDPLRGTSSMLVMDKIEGKDVEKVFKDLHKRYRKKKISREEYLSATQHIMKGTLMGLAHMEAMGLVHKDIKGDNVKFDTRTNQAVLIDMGLAQSEGEHQNEKYFFPISPPEQFHQKTGIHDKVVTSFWDSFTVGKMLFEEMERDERGKRQVLVTGSTPVKKGSIQEICAKLPQFVKGSRDAVKRTDSGEFEAQTDAKGQLIGQALKPADTPEDAAMPGRYGAATQYVDFMNRLTHPDPKQRMSPSEALKHPFMTDTFLSGEELDRVFGTPSGRQVASDEEDESEEDSGEENKGPRIDTDRLAEAYSKHRGKDSSDEDLLEEEDSELESDEENKGPRIDTEALAEAYDKHRGKDSSDADLLEDEDAELESEEKNKGPRINTDALAEAYSKQGGSDAPAEDSLEDESDEEESEVKTSAKGVLKAENAKSMNKGAYDALGSEGEKQAKPKRAEESKSRGKESAKAPYVTTVGESESDEVQMEEKAPAKKSLKQPTAAKARPAEDVDAALMKGTTALVRWQIATQQVEQQFNSAYSNLASSKAKLKAAGFTKGKKFSDYFTYNKGLDKLVKSLEEARKKKSKEVPKLAAKITEATTHYREKITRKADEDFGWANATPPVTPPFWKTLIAALDDVDKWVKS